MGSKRGGLPPLAPSTHEPLHPAPVNSSCDFEPSLDAFSETREVHFLIREVPTYGTMKTVEAKCQPWPSGKSAKNVLGCW